MIVRATAAFVACALLTVGTAGAAHRGGGTSTYTDPAGDGAKGETPDPTAPDITTITVSDDGAGTYTFKVLIPNRPTLPPALHVFLNINADKNPGTGQPNSGGADYSLWADETGGHLKAWQGTLVEVASPSFSYSWSSGPVFRVGVSDLGGTKAFTFTVAAFEFNASEPRVPGERYEPLFDVAGGLHGFVYPKATPKPKAKPVKCKPTQKRVIVHGKAKCVAKPKTK